MDIHAFSKSSRRFVPLQMEVDDAFTELLLQVEVLLFTKPGELIGYPNYGIDLEQYIFETNINTNQLQRQINRKLDSFIPRPDDVELDSTVESYMVNDEPVIIVNINVNNVKVGSFVY